MTKLQEQAVDIIRDIPEEKIMLIIEILRAFQTRHNESTESDAPEKITPKSLMGALNKYANPELIPLEKNAWAEAVREKHAAY